MSDLLQRARNIATLRREEEQKSKAQREDQMSQFAVQLRSMKEQVVRKMLPLHDALTSRGRVVVAYMVVDIGPRWFIHVTIGPDVALRFVADVRSEPAPHPAITLHIKRHDSPSRYVTATNEQELPLLFDQVVAVLAEFL